PKDLEGKTIAIPTGATQFQQWPAFMKGCGLDASKIRVTNIDPAGSPPALITGQVPAIAGYAQGYVPSVEIRGNKKARVFWYADWGVTAVSNATIVHPDLIKDAPALVRSFVAASLKGFLNGRAHVEEIAAVVKKFSEATVPAISRREAELSFDTWVTPNTAGKPLGWMSDRDWNETVAVLKQYGGGTNPPPNSPHLTHQVRPPPGGIRSPPEGDEKNLKPKLLWREADVLADSHDLLSTLERKVLPAHAALLVVDVQNDFVADGGFFDQIGADVKTIQRAIPPLVQLIDRAREAGVLVIFIQAIYDPQYLSAPMRERDLRVDRQMPRCLTGSWGADFHVIAPRANEPVVIKHRYSAFASSELDDLLKRHGIRSLLLAGVSTDTCVESTGRDAYFI